jgi:hypothetical protein
MYLLAMRKVAILVPVNEIDPELSDSWPSFSALLRGMSRTDIAFHVARLGGIVSRGARYDQREAQLRALRMIEPSAAKVDALKLYLTKHRDTDVIIVERGLLLELLRWALVAATDAANDGLSFNDIACRDRLLLALCISGTIWSGHANRGLGDQPPSARPSDTFRLSLGRRHALQNAHALEVHQLIGRSTELWRRFMPAAMPLFPSLFEAEVGLSLHDFLLITRLFYLYFLEFAQSQPDGFRDNNGVFEYDQVGKNTSVGAKIGHYLDRFSITLDDLALAAWGGKLPDSSSLAHAFVNPPDFNFSALRDRPILRSADGRCVIADAHYFAEFLLTAPLFLLPGDRVGEAIRSYGRAFEAYVIDILRRIVPSPTDSLGTRIATNLRLPPARGSDPEIDAIIGEPQGALLFEVKHAFIRDELALSGSENELRAQLAQRFGDPRKGTGQLAAWIHELTSLPSGEWPEAIRGLGVVFPIMIVSDSKFSDFEAIELAGLFREQLGLPSDVRWNPYPPISNGMNQVVRVAPIAVLNIDEVETLERLTGEHSLGEIFSEYALAGGSSVRSFSAFLSGHPTLSTGRRWNPHLRAVTLESMDELHALFPESKEHASQDLLAE